MENKVNKYLIIILVIVLIIGAYFLGKNNKDDNSEILEQQAYLQELNRSTFEKLNVRIKSLIRNDEAFLLIKTIINILD